MEKVVKEKSDLNWFEGKLYKDQNGMPNEKVKGQLLFQYRCEFYCYSFKHHYNKSLLECDKILLQESRQAQTTIQFRNNELRKLAKT